jgi:hypothetical protein
MHLACKLHESGRESVNDEAFRHSKRCSGKACFFRFNLRLHEFKIVSVIREGAERARLSTFLFRLGGRRSIRNVRIIRRASARR